jgi:hypothetical protein
MAKLRSQRTVKAELVARAELLARDVADLEEAQSAAIEKITEAIRELLSDYPQATSVAKGFARFVAERDRMLGLLRKRGRPFVLMLDDLMIAGAVAMIVERGSPFNPTRSHTTRRSNYSSACSIVQAALARLNVYMSERTIEGIWNRYKHLAGVSDADRRDFHIKVLGIVMALIEWKKQMR